MEPDRKRFAGFYPLRKEFTMCHFVWQGVGLEITFNSGASAFIQGEEGSELYDKLCACDTDEQVDNVINEYSVLEEDQ